MLDRNDFTLTTLKWPQFQQKSESSGIKIGKETFKLNVLKKYINS